MAIKNIEIQDSDGNIYYPHTNASVVKNGSTTVAEQLKEIANKVDNIKIADGTTSQKGIVQLNNTTNSTSITQAATANAVKLAMDRANSAFQSASDGKNAIAGKVGNVSGNNTHAEIANRIQVDKNTAANNLNNKGISANGNEALASLVGKINNINIEGMGGLYFITGKTKAQRSNGKTFYSINGNILKPEVFSNYISITGFNFTPVYIMYYLANRSEFCVANIPDAFIELSTINSGCYEGSTTLGSVIINKGNLLLPCTTIWEYNYIIIGG